MSASLSMSWNQCINVNLSEDGSALRAPITSIWISIQLWRLVIYLLPHVFRLCFVPGAGDGAPAGQDTSERGPAAEVQGGTDVQVVHHQRGQVTGDALQRPHSQREQPGGRGGRGPLYALMDERAMGRSSQ